MISSSSISSYVASSLLLLGALSPFTSAHMEMSLPFPMRSRLNPANSDPNIDYNLKSPLNANGSNFPCHGYQNDPFQATATYTAGKTYQMTIAGTVLHGGGSCQLSLSYDNGATFKVIKSMIGGCPFPQQYDFTIPSFAPSGNALFAWTWFNEIGNREMYMNCAQVQISGSSSHRRSRVRRDSTFTSMDSLPNIWRANIEINQCTTTEGDDVVFPNAGPDVDYSNTTRTKNSPKDTQQGCDNADPAGQTFNSAGSSGTPAQGSPFQPSTTSSSTTFLSLPSVTSATGGIFAEGANTTTSSSTFSSTQAPAAPPFSNTTTTSTGITPQAMTTTTAASASSTTWTGSAYYLNYASVANSSQYLPCVPGTMLCTSSSTYLTCLQGDGITPMTPVSSYTGVENVAAGMQCTPFLTPFRSEQNATAFENQNGVVPDGWYRSDRYERAVETIPK